MLATGDWEGEMIKLTRDGRSIVVEERWTLVRDAAGVPKSIFTINSDVTERKKLESQLIVSDRMASVGTLDAGGARITTADAVIANLDSYRETCGCSGGKARGHSGARRTPPPVWRIERAARRARERRNGGAPLSG